MRPGFPFHRWRYALAGAVLAALLVACGAVKEPQVIILVGGGISASAVPEPGASEGDVSIARGQRAYEEVCAACHGMDGHGLPGLGKDLVTPSEWFLEQDDESLVQFLKVGRTAADPLNTTKVDMPPRGGNPSLNDDDLMAIVLYLRSLQEEQ